MRGSCWRWRRRSEKIFDFVLVIWRAIMYYSGIFFKAQKNFKGEKMKSQIFKAVAVCGVLALVAAGCKYDDEAALTDSEAAQVEIGDDAGGATDVDTVGGGADIADASALGSLEGEDGVPATGLTFDQDPNYTRCTDVNFDPVYFGFDASNLANAELAKIEAVAQHLQANATRVVIVEGNCDERGSNEYNLSLGELRAVSIRDYLVTLGIGPERVQTKSYGEEKPAVIGQGEAAWSKNRRGEFAVFQHK